MTKDRTPSSVSYELFLKQALAQEEIYGLQDSDGSWAICPSEADEAKDVILVWSQVSEAARHQKEEWKTYKPTAIPLEEFVAEWLKGMHYEGSLVGPNWDESLSGLEVPPEEVAKRLTGA